MNNLFDTQLNILTVSYGVRTMNDSNDYLYCCFLFRISSDRHIWNEFSTRGLALSPTFTLRHINSTLFLHILVEHSVCMCACVSFTVSECYAQHSIAWHSANELSPFVYTLLSSIQCYIRCYYTDSQQSQHRA